MAQIYLQFPVGVGRPPRRLVGWQKVLLAPGATPQIAIQTNEGDTSHPLSYWDVSSGAWRTAPGDYPVYLGTSSNAASLTLVGTLNIVQ